MKQRLNRAIVSSQVSLSQLTELCALPLHSLVGDWRGWNGNNARQIYSWWNSCCHKTQKSREKLLERSPWRHVTGLCTGLEILDAFTYTLNVAVRFKKKRTSKAPGPIVTSARLDHVLLLLMTYTRHSAKHLLYVCDFLYSLQQPMR